jgi:hypothetical protein
MLRKHVIQSTFGSNLPEKVTGREWTSPATPNIKILCRRMVVDHSVSMFFIRIVGRILGETARK